MAGGVAQFYSRDGGHETCLTLATASMRCDACDGSTDCSSETQQGVMIGTDMLVLHNLVRTYIYIILLHLKITTDFCGHMNSMTVRIGQK